MARLSKIAAAMAGLAVATSASLARADGFFITFTNADGATVGARVAGAVFDASAKAPVDEVTGLKSGSTTYNPVHIELDEFGPTFEPLLAAYRDNRPMTATAEFTTPNASGVEEVYMVGRYAGVKLVAWPRSSTRGARPC